jgi:hypothetical protein
MDTKTLEQDVRQAIDDGDKMKGLGDLVARGTKMIGLNECGGCAKRRERLNTLFPFKNKKK